MNKKIQAMTNKKMWAIELSDNEHQEEEEQLELSDKEVKEVEDIKEVRK